MSFFSKTLSKLNLTVGSSGLKHDIVVFFGRIFHLGRPSSSRFGNIVLHTKNHPEAEIVAHAPDNFYRYFPDSPLGKWMTVNLREGDIFVDIGANLGGYALLAKVLGARVIAFEPVPALTDFLSENEHAFGSVNALALSDEVGEVSFYLGKNLEGSSVVRSTESDERSGYTGTTRVKRTTFDIFFAAEIERKTLFPLVKIDVEGHEAAVVRGMMKALSMRLIGALWCEVRGPGSDRNPNSYKEVCQRLKSNRYDCFLFDGSVLTPFDFEEIKETECPRFFDLLFVKSSSSD